MLALSTAVPKSGVLGPHDHERGRRCTSGTNQEATPGRRATRDYSRNY